jgi:hypothetical protein
VVIPDESVTWAKKGSEQVPVRRGRPSNVAVAGTRPMNVVKRALVTPVTVETKELVVLLEALDAVVSEEVRVVLWYE